MARHHNIDGEMVPFSPEEEAAADAEAAAWNAGLADRAMGAIREERSRRIAAVAWRYERHAREQRLGLPLSDDIEILDAYIQALADFPETVTDPLDPPPWPVSP